MRALRKIEQAGLTLRGTGNEPSEVSSGGSHTRTAPTVGVHKDGKGGHTAAHGPVEAPGGAGGDAAGGDGPGRRLRAGRGEIDTGGVVREDAAVNMVARDAGRATAGPEGFREIWAEWLEPWQSYRIYYEEVVERDDRVIMLVRLRGVTKHDGVEMEQEAAGTFRFEGDQVVEMEFNLDRESALNG